ncbi:MAG TPA: hypothetical protein VHO69_06355 [Phototrophicaceae bacterium]|nr:hypothetical protein [Phototrophicaceae bacterium]
MGGLKSGRNLAGTQQVVDGCCSAKGDSGRCEKFMKMVIGDGKDVIWVLMFQY